MKENGAKRKVMGVSLCGKLIQRKIEQRNDVTQYGIFLGDRVRKEIGRFREIF
jgi:hypothetical protein